MSETGRPPVLMKYTSLSSAVHIVRSRSLPLLDPSRWDDKNDGQIMRLYAEAMGGDPVRASCFTQAEETYHHWSVFAGGADGVRLEIDKARLVASLDNGGAIYGEVRYLTIPELRAGRGVAPTDLAFVKRAPYADEREFRILAFAAQDVAVPLALAWIKRITLSPWMPPTVAQSVKAMLKGQPGCGRLRVYQSTLVGNADWRAAARRIANGRIAGGAAG